MATTEWSFEGDYFTACNCDWGCPCNFNARPTEGNCHGWGVWRIDRGRFGATRLDGGRFAVYYDFPGRVEEGNGTTCAYVDSRLPAGQRQALDAIATGQAGGGIFELFARQLSSKVLPTRFVPIEFDVQDGKGVVRIEGIAEAETNLLSYPDGTTIEPWLELPHGIEYKRGLMTDTKRWWWRDEELLASHRRKYGAAARVKFDQTGCVG
ncbi:MAG: DUF1326 domain-containing protein [Candidatus Rokuibacteriota bacterium]